MQIACQDYEFVLNEFSFYFRSQKWARLKAFWVPGSSIYKYLKKWLAPFDQNYLLVFIHQQFVLPKQILPTIRAPLGESRV